MYQLVATSLISDWKYTKDFSTMEELNAFVQEQEAKPKKWSKFFGARPIPKSEVPENLLPLIESEEDRTIQEASDGVEAVIVRYANLKAEYVITTEDITAQYEAEQNLKALISSGENDFKCCQEVRYLIGGYNRYKNLTNEQLQLMLSTYANINFALQNQMPLTAKTMINLISVDDVITTQELKDLINKVFDKYGIA